MNRTEPLEQLLSHDLDRDAQIHDPVIVFMPPESPSDLPARARRHAPKVAAVFLGLGAGALAVAMKLQLDRARVRAQRRLIWAWLGTAAATLPWLGRLRAPHRMS